MMEPRSKCGSGPRPSLSLSSLEGRDPTPYQKGDTDNALENTLAGSRLGEDFQENEDEKLLLAILESVR
jgi:hypothetical protein